MEQGYAMRMRHAIMLLLAAGLLPAVGGCATPSDSTSPAAAATPVETLTLFHAYLREGRTWDYRRMIHVRGGGPWVAEVHDRYDQMSAYLQAGRYDFVPLESNTRGRCAVVIINENRKHYRPAFDLDPAYMIREADGWKLLASLTSYDDRLHVLTQADLANFAELQKWYEGREAEISAQHHATTQPAGS